MANLIQAAQELEFVPKQQLIQMSQDPNANYPSYLVLSEIQRRTQMEKMYAAQQPKPTTTVSEELVADFANNNTGLGAMAQSSDIPNAFQSGEMGNMAPPSPMQMMASGGKTGYQSGGLTRQQVAEANTLGIDIANLSDEEIIRQINLSNDKRRKDFLLGMTPDLTQFSPTSLAGQQFNPENLLNPSQLPAGLQAQIDAAKEPSGFDKFIEGGTQFFFGDPRPDAERPNLARMTDEPLDYLNYIPIGGVALKGGIKGIQAIRAARDARTLLALGGPGVKGTNLIPRTGTSLVPTGINTSKNIDRMGAIPATKGLMNRGINWIKNNPRKSILGALGIGVPAGVTTWFARQDPEGEVDIDGDVDNDKKLTTEEIKRSIDPLDLAKLGGIIMGARNTSELGQGITALAGDIQERKYKEKVLTAKGLEALQDKYNIFTEELQRLADAGKQDTPQYRNTELALANIVAQLQGLSGAEGTDYGALIDKVTKTPPSSTDTTTDTESKGIAGKVQELFSNPLAPFLAGPVPGTMNISKKIFEKFYDFAQKPKSSPMDSINIEEAQNQLTPNPNDEGYASTEFLTGDPLVDNIIRIESSGRDVVNDTTGATGPMQVLPSTLIDPGYGIDPAKNNSVEEKIRVGEDYFYAMVDKYNGDVFLGTLAYNLGPGNVDTWLKSGGDINTLKSITSKDGRPIGESAYQYVVKAYGQDAVNRRLT